MKHPGFAGSLDMEWPYHSGYQTSLCTTQIWWKSCSPSLKQRIL